MLYIFSVLAFFLVVIFVLIFFRLIMKVACVFLGFFSFLKQFCVDFRLNPSGNTEADLQENV